MPGRSTAAKRGRASPSSGSTRPSTIARNVLATAPRGAAAYGRAAWALMDQPSMWTRRSRRHRRGTTPRTWPGRVACSSQGPPGEVDEHVLEARAKQAQVRHHGAELDGGAERDRHELCAAVAVEAHARRSRGNATRRRG